MIDWSSTDYAVMAFTLLLLCLLLRRWFQHEWPHIRALLKWLLTR